MHVRVPTDYATIQTAIDAVASEGTIEIVAGTYVEALTIWKPVTLVGGEVPAEIAACDEALYGAVVLHEAGAVAVERLRLAGSWTACGCTIALRNTAIDAPEGAGLELEGAATATLHEVSVTSATGSGVRVTGTAHASLDACRFAGCRDGIVVDERGHVDAVACTIASSRLAGASVASAEGSATFHECGFLGNAEGLSSAGTTTLDHCAFDAQLCAIRVANGETRMIGCAVRGSRETGLYAFGGTAHASDCVFAETEGAGAVYCDEDGRVEMAGCTLAENLGHGVYAQQDARVTLTGCTIADNGLSDTEWADAAGILLSDAAIVRLDGCSIGRNAGCGIEVRPLSPLWRIDPSIPEGAPPDCELHMTDCRIFENAGDGLWVTSARSIEIEGTVFERNGGYGIVVDEEFGGRLQLMGCRILENLECGITIGGAKEATLEGCTVAGNAQIGVLVAGSADATIRRCLVQGNLIGVALAQSPHVDLTGCEIRGNLGYGLQVYCLECSGGRQYHSASLDFVGELTGGGNVIPDGSGLDGNGMGGICPAEGWELLLVGGGETSDV